MSTKCTIHNGVVGGVHFHLYRDNGFQKEPDGLFLDMYVEDTRKQLDPWTHGILAVRVFLPTGVLEEIAGAVMRQKTAAYDGHPCPRCGQKPLAGSYHRDACIEGRCKKAKP